VATAIIGHANENAKHYQDAIIVHDLLWDHYSTGWIGRVSGLGRGCKFHRQQLLPPGSAIDPSEDAVNIEAAIAIRATFSEDPRAVRALFDARVELLTGNGSTD
jgi:hypothetical protein